MAQTLDYAGDTLVVSSIVTGVNTPGMAQFGNPNSVGMDIGGVIFGAQTANNTSFTVTTMTTLQPVFNISSNGACTVSANQTYMFEGQYTVQAATNASHAWSVGFGGNATVASIGYQFYSTVNATSTGPNGSANAFYVSTTAASPFTGTCTASAESTLLFLNGMLTVGTTGGTLIPQIKLNVGTTPATTITVYKGSYFGLWPIGNATTQTVGSWS
jgi:hypothetical protein